MSTENLPVIKRRVGRPKKVKPEDTNETPILKTKGRPSLNLTQEEKNVRYNDIRNKWNKQHPELNKQKCDLYHTKNKMLINVIKNMLNENVIIDKYKTIVEQILNNDIN